MLRPIIPDIINGCPVPDELRLILESIEFDDSERPLNDPDFDITDSIENQKSIAELQEQLNQLQELVSAIEANTLQPRQSITNDIPENATSAIINFPRTVTEFVSAIPVGGSLENLYIESINGNQVTLEWTNPAPNGTQIIATAYIESEAEQP